MRRSTSRTRVMWSAALALLMAIGPGCGGCGDEPVRTPQAGSSAAVKAADPQPTAGAPDAKGSYVDPPAASAGAHRLAAGWGRTIGAEPSPEARGLYRRAIERVHAGAAGEATPLFARIRDDFGDSRFATRLRGGGDPAATAALLGLAATVGAAAFSGALRSLKNPQNAAPTRPQRAPKGAPR